MTEASASYQLRVNAGSYAAADTAVDASEGDTITARLVSVEGINGSDITWTIFGTHGGTAPALTEGGTPSGQEVSFTVPGSLAPDGGAYGLQCDVNGGSVVTKKSATTSKSAVYVANSASARPMFYGETNEGNSTHGVVPRLNAAATLHTALRDENGVSRVIVATGGSVDIVSAGTIDFDLDGSPVGSWTSSNDRLRILGAGSIRFESNGAKNTETLVADKVIGTTGHPHWQILDGGASDRNVDLPAEADNDGNFFHMRNAGSTNNLVVRDDAAATIVTLAPGARAHLICDGTTWDYA